MELHQPGGHHHQVGQDVVLSDQPAHRMDGFRHPGRCATVDQLLVLQLAFLAPGPGVVERLDLCL